MPFSTLALAGLSRSLASLAALAAIEAAAAFVADDAEGGETERRDWLASSSTSLRFLFARAASSTIVAEGGEGRFSPLASRSSAPVAASSPFFLLPFFFSFLPVAVDACSTARRIISSSGAGFSGITSATLDAVSGATAPLLDEEEAGALRAMYPGSNVAEVIGQVAFADELDEDEDEEEPSTALRPDSLITAPLPAARMKTKRCEPFIGRPVSGQAKGAGNCSSSEFWWPLLPFCPFLEIFAAELSCSLSSVTSCPREGLKHQLAELHHLSHVWSRLLTLSFLTCDIFAPASSLTPLASLTLL